jgi:hypothetical protein
VDNENLSQEEVQSVWNEEAAKLDADDSSSANQLLATMPDEDPPQIQDNEVDQAASELEAATESETEEDPLAGLSDVVRAKLAQIDDLATANAQLLHHVKTAEGRVAAMQREFEQARKAATQTSTQEAPSQGQIATAAKNPEKWDQLKQDFPEWADAMEEYVTSKLGSNQAAPNLTSEQVVDFVKQQVDASKAEMGRLLEEARIEGKYENWRDVVNTTEFAQWFTVQNPQTRALADSSSARDALRMLDLFHSTKTRSAADIKQERGQRLAAAATTRPGSTPPPKTLDDMSPAELWNYEATKREKLKAQRGF